MGGLGGCGEGVEVQAASKLAADNIRVRRYMKEKGSKAGREIRREGAPW